MWRLKGCVRCTGDLFIEKDLDGWYESCLQCGHREQLRLIAEVPKQPLATMEKAAVSPTRRRGPRRVERVPTARSS
jgi:hypothetical protein